MTDIPESSQEKPAKRKYIGGCCGCLVFIVIGFLAFSCVSLKAINRARIVAALSNLRNLENAVLQFQALPSVQGALPITEGTGNVAVIWNGIDLETRKSSEPYILEQALLAADAIERLPTWGTMGIGKDGPSHGMSFFNEPVFSLTHNAYYAEGMIYRSGSYERTSGKGNDWSPYNRSEVSLIDDTCAPGDPERLPVRFIDGIIDRVNFYLDGRTPLQGKRCAYVILKDVQIKDARVLSAEVNGKMDNTSRKINRQYRGRLIFAPPVSPETTTDVYYYLWSDEHAGPDLASGRER
jgi:hypothetical protein